MIESLSLASSNALTSGLQRLAIPWPGGRYKQYPGGGLPVLLSFNLTRKFKLVNVAARAGPDSDPGPAGEPESAADEAWPWHGQTRSPSLHRASTDSEPCRSDASESWPAGGQVKFRISSAGGGPAAVSRAKPLASRAKPLLNSL
jgi:hypothetical protein